MKYALAILITLIAILPPVALGGTEQTSEQRRSVKQFQEVKWTIILSIHDIESGVLNSLRSRFGRDDRLANVDEPFNPTDVLDERPNRRLVLAGHAGTLWFIAYERGGYSHYLKLVVFDTNVGPPMLTFAASGQAGSHESGRWRVNIQDIEAALRNGRLSIDDIKHQYY